MYSMPHVLLPTCLFLALACSDTRITGADCFDQTVLSLVPPLVTSQTVLLEIRGDDELDVRCTFTLGIGVDECDPKVELWNTDSGLSEIRLAAASEALEVYLVTSDGTVISDATIAIEREENTCDDPSIGPFYLGEGTVPVDLPPDAGPGGAGGG